MGYIRKALSIGTLGLSNLVLEDESKQPAKSTRARSRPRKRTKAKAKTQLKTSASRSEGEHKTASAKPRPARAKPKAASRATKATSRTRAAGARTAKAPAARTSAVRASAARAKPVLAGRPEQSSVQPPKPEAQPKPDMAPTSTTARSGATGNGVAIALERISALHEHGALTDREFAAAKTRILGTSPTPGSPEASSATFPAIEANVAAARRIGGYPDPDREPSATTMPGAPGRI